MLKTALVVLAIVLGYLSPWLASPDDGAILFAWFNWLPILADQWLLLDGTPALVLDVSILAAQYLAVFVAAAPLLRPASQLLLGLRQRTSGALT